VNTTKIIKFFLALGFLFVGSLVLATSIWRVSAKTANLNFKVSPVVLSNQTTPVPSITPEPKAEYVLVYPGILPDNIFYPIKMIRDRIVLMLTTDPLKRAEIVLLYADKRLGGAQALIDGGKADLGVTTATKGEKYLEQSVLEMEKAKAQGKDTAGLKEKINNASFEHEEILTSLLPKVTEGNRATLEEAIKQSHSVYLNTLSE
jgi:hypothetical protein